MTSSAAIARHSVDEILEEYRAVGFRPNFGPDGTRFLVSLYRQMASTGKAIPLDEALANAEDVGMSKDDALDFLAGKAERGDDDEAAGSLVCRLTITRMAWR